MHVVVFLNRTTLLTSNPYPSRLVTTDPSDARCRGASRSLDCRTAVATIGRRTRAHDSRELDPSIKKTGNVVALMIAGPNRGQKEESMVIMKGSMVDCFFLFFSVALVARGRADGPVRSDRGAQSVYPARGTEPTAATASYPESRVARAGAMQQSGGESGSAAAVQRPGWPGESRGAGRGSAAGRRGLSGERKTLAGNAGRAPPSARGPRAAFVQGGIRRWRDQQRQARRRKRESKRRVQPRGRPPAFDGPRPTREIGRRQGAIDANKS
jgi:hypothetical protein